MTMPEQPLGLARITLCVLRTDEPVDLIVPVADADACENLLLALAEAFEEFAPGLVIVTGNYDS